MRKTFCADFELIQDIIKTIDFNYEASAADKIEALDRAFEASADGIIKKSARVYDISRDDTVTIACRDAAAANELYMEKDKLLNKMEEKVLKLGIKIKDIKFDYKKWKEKTL